MELFSIRIQRTFQLVSTFKNQFEIDENKYHGIVERNRSNGSKGVLRRERRMIIRMILEQPK